MKFQTRVSGYVTGVRFYKSFSNTGEHIGNLWTSAGRRLATAVFRNEAAHGWQQVAFSVPVRVEADTTYVVSYHSDVSQYSFSDEYFADGSHARGPLVALGDGVDGPNGVYAYGGSGYPSKSWRASNYWVDIIFNNEPTAPSTTGLTRAPTQSKSGAAMSTTNTTSIATLWPGKSDTGYLPTGVTLHNCSSSLNVAGAVMDSCLFTGDVIVTANNVTIRRSKVVGGRISTGYGTQQTGLEIFDTEIDGQNALGFGISAIGASNYSCIRCNIHATSNGLYGGNNVMVTDSWVHDLFYMSGEHIEGFLSNGGANLTIVHNNLDCHVQAGAADRKGGCSAALSLFGDFGQVDGVLVQNNLFNTDGSYCSYAGSVPEKPYPQAINVRFIGNHYGREYERQCGQYGPVWAWKYNTGNVWSGNVWDDTGAIISP